TSARRRRCTPARRNEVGPSNCAITRPGDGGRMSKQMRQTLGTTLSVGMGFVLVIGAGALSARQGARPSAAAQKIDDAYTKKIVDGTPDKRILTELVDHMPLPADPKVPSPLKVLGYIPGENGNLTYS